MSNLNIIIFILLSSSSSSSQGKLLYFDTTCGSKKKKKGRSEVLREEEFGSRSANTYLNSDKGHDSLRTLKECIGQTKLNLKIKTIKLLLYLMR